MSSNYNRLPRPAVVLINEEMLRLLWKKKCEHLLEEIVPRHLDRMQGIDSDVAITKLEQN